MNEASLTKKIVARLRKEGAFVAKIHGGVHQASGLPDVIGCYEEELEPGVVAYKAGIFFGIEVKMPGREKTLTPKQKYKLQKIKEAGGRVGVAVNVQQAFCIMIGAPDDTLYDWENHGNSD